MFFSDTFPEGLSILIPSWNNLAYLKACVRSIKQYSTFNHQIIIHVNKGDDGTLTWVKRQGLEFTHTDENMGVCIALNQARKLAKRRLTMYANDDMFFLPSWDVYLYLFSGCLGLDDSRTTLSSTMIEPTSSNPCCLAPRYYGDTIGNFQEVDIIRDISKLRKEGRNLMGSTWPPNIISTEAWDMVGGYSEEFSPGFGSDPDLVKKLWDKGFRNFISVGESLVYHFACKTTRVKSFTHNNGEAQFLNKHGMTISRFVTQVLRRGEDCAIGHQ